MLRLAKIRRTVDVKRSAIRNPPAPSDETPPGKENLALLAGPASKEIEGCLAHCDGRCADALTAIARVTIAGVWSSKGHVDDSGRRVDHTDDIGVFCKTKLDVD